MIEQLCEEIIKGNNVRENLIQLNQQIKSAEGMEAFLDVYYTYEAEFVKLLDHEDAKVRKNILKLLGSVAEPVLLDNLFEHYRKETTQFLKADYLDAMKHFEYEAYLPEFQKRMDELLAQERTKHSSDELKQLQKLVWKFNPPMKHTFQTSGNMEKIVLVVPRGHENAVLEELKAIPDTEGRAIAGGCMVQTKQLEDVKKLRTYQVLLFDFCPVGIPSDDGEVIGKALLEQGLLRELQKHHKESHPFVFRVDVKGVTEPAKKNKLAHRLALTLEAESQGSLVNDSSYYEIELRVIVGSKGSRVLVKLNTDADERFKYRKYAMATSMQPSKAALMMHYVKPYMKEDANVLDPFCGTGVLLLERLFAGKAKSCYGLDISGPAIQATWENSQNAGKTLNLIQRNLNDFRHEYTFDEILTDMPRQSANMKPKQLEAVYQLLFLRSRELLAEQGILAVYCEDAVLMERNIREHGWLKRIKKIPMTKDQSSWLFILQKLYN